MRSVFFAAEKPRSCYSRKQAPQAGSHLDRLLENDHRSCRSVIPPLFGLLFCGPRSPGFCRPCLRACFSSLSRVVVHRVAEARAECSCARCRPLGCRGPILLAAARRPPSGGMQREGAAGIPCHPSEAWKAPGGSTAPRPRRYLVGLFNRRNFAHAVSGGLLPVCAAARTRKIHRRRGGRCAVFAHDAFMESRA